MSNSHESNEFVSQGIKIANESKLIYIILYKSLS